MMIYKTIQVFEHQTLQYGRSYGGVEFLQKHFEALAKLNMLHENKYFTLLHKGIKFSQYVGVVQIDGLTIEILPKVDASVSDTGTWRNVLTEMLKQTRGIRVHQVGQAHLIHQNMHVLDIYFEWFLRAVETLIRQGLIKKYYSETKNVKALKGKLEFAGHVARNNIHKERFYTTHQIYDREHLLHQILQQALLIIEHFSRGSYLYAHCKRVQLNFPEVSTIRCTAKTFDRLKLDRKSKPYMKALEIARLIILNYAPNISSGKENMLALLFDMNLLWQDYILAQLKRAALNRSVLVHGQQSKPFWNTMTLRPDIVLWKKESDGSVLTCIIDTKWKRIAFNHPSPDDVRQMYVYNDHWKSAKAILLYPGNQVEEPYTRKFHIRDHWCEIMKVQVVTKDGHLNIKLGEELLERMQFIQSH